MQNDVVPRTCVRGLEQLRQEVKGSGWQSEVSDRLASAAERYRSMASVLRVGDARSAGALGTLGDTWEALTAGAARHSCVPVFASACPPPDGGGPPQVSAPESSYCRAGSV